MDINELETLIQNEINSAEYAITDDKAIVLDYYFGNARGDEIKGRSDAQSRDIHDMTEALTAQLMKSFSSEEMAKFEALMENDEEQASLESKAVNHLFFKRNKGSVIILEALKDALMMRNCIAQVYVDTKVTAKTYNFDFVDENTLVVVSERLTPNQEIHNITETSVTVKTVEKRICIDSVPPEEFLFSRSWDRISLEECPFTARHRVLQRWELVKMGYDVDIINGLPQSSSDGYQINIRKEGDEIYAENSLHKSNDPIDYYECFYIIDYNDDGISELLRVCYASNQIIHVEEVDYHIFVGGQTNLLPHRFKGNSIYDQQKDIQDVKTKTLRHWIDNINQHNNRRLEVVKSAVIDMNDVLVSKPAGIIKVKVPNSIREIPVSDIGPSCNNLLSYADKIRTNRSGAALDMVSENIPMYNETAHGAERIISSKEMIAFVSAFTFTKTFLNDLFLLIHRTIKDSGFETYSAKSKSGWFNTVVSRWLPRDSVELDIMPSQGDMIRLMQVYNNIMQQQMQANGAGLANILVTAKNAYNLAIDYARISGVNNPGRYWTDPESEQAVQTAQRNSDEQQRVKQLQEKLQVAISNSELIKAKSQEAQVKARAIIDGLKLDLEKAKSALSVAKDNETLLFDYNKHYDDIAMRLTELETQYNQEINDYKENKQQVS